MQQVAQLNLRCQHAEKSAPRLPRSWSHVHVTRAASFARTQKRAEKMGRFVTKLFALPELQSINACTGETQNSGT